MSKEIKHHRGDRDIQVILGSLLRIGVVASMVVVLIGGGLYLWEHGFTVPDYRVFKPAEHSYISIVAIIKGVISFKSAAIIQFGILLLIFTPILRIVFSVFSFLLEGDYMYVVIGMIVLAIIMVSLNGGFAH